MAGLQISDVILLYSQTIPRFELAKAVGFTMRPPLPPQHPSTRTIHQQEVCDPFSWMEDIDHPDTLPYLDAENAYTEFISELLEGLRQSIFTELLSRTSTMDRDGSVYHWRVDTVCDDRKTNHTGYTEEAILLVEPKSYSMEMNVRKVRRIFRSTRSSQSLANTHGVARRYPRTRTVYTIRSRFTHQRYPIDQSNPTSNGHWHGWMMIILCTFVETMLNALVASSYATFTLPNRH